MPEVGAGSFVVPEALAASKIQYWGESGRAWVEDLPRQIAHRLHQWDLRRDGAPRYGQVALVLPVVRADGTRAVLKLQEIDEETRGEPTALRTWAGQGAVLLLECDPGSGALLLERLDPDRCLAEVPDDRAAIEVVARLLAALTAHRAPSGLRTLANMAAGTLDRSDGLIARLADPADRRLLRRCARVVGELLPEPGDRLLHWDLHLENVLAPEPGHHRDGTCLGWVAIDPKPLAGDPGFELLPTLRDRWSQVVAGGDVARAVRGRFDLMTEVMGLDRARAAGWTLGRVLSNALWEIADHQATRVGHTREAAVAQALMGYL